MRTTVEIIGSMESGRGTCLVYRDGVHRPVVIDCGASPANFKRSRLVERIVDSVTVALPEFLALSHFHFDHCGGIPLVAERMASFGMPVPGIISTDTTFALLDKYTNSAVQRAFSSRVEIIPNKHSVPGSAGVLVRGEKTVFYSGDCYGIDLPDNFPEIDLLIMDCTGAMREEPREDKEAKIRENIVTLVSGTLLSSRFSRAYIALFSSQLERAVFIQNESKRLICKYPLLKGMSLFRNLNVFRSAPRSDSDTRVVMATGIWAQGENSWLCEEASAMVKISNGMDAECELKEGDLVILSGSIPTWSPAVTRQIESMCRRLGSSGARVVVDTTAPEEWAEFAERWEVHAGGHGNMPEIAGVIQKIRPKMVLPFHASSQARAKVQEYCKLQGLQTIPEYYLPEITL